MADGENKSQSFDYSDQRFKYIGFDVFPGKAGDIFKSDEERKTLIQRVRERLAKSQGEVRERCTLMESRVSGIEKGFLAAAAVVMVVALFLPWYSGSIPISYQEVDDVENVSFFYSSATDERLIGYVANALKEKRQRMLRFTGTTEGAETEEKAEPPGAIDEPAETVGEEAGVAPGDTMAAAAPVESAADTGVAEIPSQEAAPSETRPARPATEGLAVAPVLRVVFVNTTDKDSIRTTEDLREHVVAYYEFDSRTDRESLRYGADAALAEIPAVMNIAQKNDSIIDARMDKILMAAEEAGKPSRRTTEEQRQAKVDSILADTVNVAARLSVFGDQSITTSEMRASGIVNDTYSLTGIGGLFSLGEYLPMIFSSGPVLVITGILMVVFYICCPLLAVLNLYVLFGVKGSNQEKYVLMLKRWLRWNWVPVFIWLAMFILSFFGATYGFDTSGMLKQVGSSYNVATFIGLSSVGIYLVLMAFLITALKGKEI